MQLKENLYAIIVIKVGNERKQIKDLNEINF